MAVRLSPTARQQFLDSAGNPYVGAKLFTYLAGTSTKQATYTTSIGDVANTNPIVLDASGRTPSGLWLTEGANYKFVLAPAYDTDPPTSPIYTEDDIKGINDQSAFSDPVATAYLKTVSDIINGSEISLLRFVNPTEHSAILAGTSTYDATADVQAALSAGPISLFVPDGSYGIPTQVRTFSDGVSLRGSRRAVLNVGAGQVAGAASIAIFNSGFRVHGLKVVSSSRTTAFYVQPPSAADIEDFEFNSTEFLNCFYAVRGDGAADRLVRHLKVLNCKSVAPVGEYAGHFMIDHGRHITYALNRVKYGLNSSAYGVADSSGIIIANNIEELVSDTATNVEAAIQIEDCIDARAVVFGNVCQHDIWVAGSGGVAVSDNECRTLRASVGNVGGYDVDARFEDNVVGRLVVDKFSTADPAERITARFINNTLDPAAYTFNGAALGSAVYINGNVCDRVDLIGTDVKSSAATSCVSLSRAAGMTLNARDNNFGAQGHSIYGAGGLVYERTNSNPLYKSDNGYIAVTLASSLTAPALSGWTKLLLNAVRANTNGEWDASSGQFTVAESGRYEFSGIMTVDPDAAGSQMGFRLYRTSGTPAELARLAFLRAADANSHGVTFRTVSLYLTAGDVIELDYFLTGATTSILSGATVSLFEIKRVS